MKPLKTAVIVCGRISDIYFKTLAKYDAVEVVACARLRTADRGAPVRYQRSRNRYEHRWRDRRNLRRAWL